MNSPQVLLIGAGPAGLSAAACLKHEGVALRWVDRSGKIGGAYRTMYRRLILASPARYNGLPGLGLKTAGEYLTAPAYLEYLQGYASHHELMPEKNEVSAVARSGGGFLVRFKEGDEARFDAVVVAAGAFDNPIRPAIDGLSKTGGPEIIHTRDWQGPASLSGRRVLIIGGGVSGVEIAEECARHDLTVDVSSRSGRVKTVPQRILGLEIHDYAAVLERFPTWVLGSFCARHPALPGTDLGFWRFVKEGRIEIRGEVRRFEGATAFFDDDSKEYDTVILAVGFRFDIPFLPADVARSPGGHPQARGCESRSWPGLFFMGYPCARGLDSEFLRGMARDAPILARRLRAMLS